jgi:hypothetical protein
MRRAIGLLVFSIALGFFSTAARADVFVATSLDVPSFGISPSIGSVMLLSPFTASANAEAQDDLSGFNFQFNQANDTSTSSTSAATAFASASAAASTASDAVGSLSASASSGINIPGATSSFASSTGQGGLGGDFGGTGLFEILSTSNTSVDVTFSATLSGSQTLTTDAYGDFATSEIVFNLVLPDIGSTVLFLDNPLSIGPSATLVSSYSNTLTNTVSLQTNTDYTFIAEADAESSGLNVPEPSALFLTAFVSLAVLFSGRCWRRQRESRKTA